MARSAAFGPLAAVLCGCVLLAACGGAVAQDLPGKTKFDKLDYVLTVIYDSSGFKTWPNLAVVYGIDELYNNVTGGAIFLVPSDEAMDMSVWPPALVAAIKKYGDVGLANLLRFHIIKGFWSAGGIPPPALTSLSAFSPFVTYLDGAPLYSYTKSNQPFFSPLNIDSFPPFGIVKDSNPLSKRLAQSVYADLGYVYNEGTGGTNDGVVNVITIDKVIYPEDLTLLGQAVEVPTPEVPAPAPSVAPVPAPAPAPGSGAGGPGPSSDGSSPPSGTGAASHMAASWAPALVSAFVALAVASF